MVPTLFFSLLPAIDLLYGGIYCFVCQDYIYDKDMEQIAKEEQRKAWKLQGIAFCFPSENFAAFETRPLKFLSAVTFVFLCIHRHRGEIHNVGADQEGARVITTQSKAEENHYKLYHRWAIDCTDPSVQLFISIYCVCACVCVSTSAYGASVLGVTLAFKCDTKRQQDRAAPQAAHCERQNTVFPL